MHPIVYYIIFFLAIGAVGMVIANKKADPAVRRKGWLKYFTYIIFTGAVILGIFYIHFVWVAGIIAAACLIELFKVNFSKPALSIFQNRISLFVFLAIASGFTLFAGSFNSSFLLFIYFQILVFDGFCQITGQLFGKHQLIPEISPAKTAEGLMGGWLCCIIAAMMAANWVYLSLPEAALYGLLTGFTSFCGDLLASWYKRKMNVKDYSNWLPGQGGFLDRFDSFLFTGAVYYLLYVLIFKDRFIDFIK
jgi:phosphatidate cytidylyltransferase